MTDGTEAAAHRTAQHWVARLASREIAEQELNEFRLWHDASERHSQAFRLERDRWLQLERTRHVFERGIAEDRRCLRQRRLVWMPLGGAIAAMLIAFIVVGNPISWPRADHVTRVGEVRSWRLPDGSEAWLSSNSAIDVAYTTNERRVRLLRGEAWFEVRRAPERAFIVEAANVQAIARGTAFDVVRGAGGVSVQVTHGVVEVRRDDARVAELTAGRAAEIDANVETTVRSFSQADALAWREGKIMLNDLRFEDALAQIDRYRPGRILLWGSARSELVSAILTLDRLDEGLDAIAASHGLAVVRVTPWLAIVH